MRAPARRPLRLALGALLLLPGSLFAQGSLADGVLEARLPPEGGPLPVALEYRLLPEAGAGEVPFTILTPESTRVTALRASWGGGDLPLQIRELRPHYWSGALAPLPGEDPFTLHLSYTVEEGWSREGRVTVPILAVGWAPREPHPRTFVARVRVPEGLTVTQSFPTSVVDRPRGAEGGLYEVALQGVPSMLVLRVVRGDAPLLNLERTLDLLVLVTLLAMGIAGVRFLRGNGR